jgi:transcriptional regulator with PAS, ATPase and Fis domain
MMIMCENERIGINDLPEEIRDLACSPQSLGTEGLTLKESVQRLEMQMIQAALQGSDSLADTAAVLDIHPTTLWRKMTRYELMQK